MSALYSHVFKILVSTVYLAFSTCIFHFFTSFIFLLMFFFFPLLLPLYLCLLTEISSWGFSQCSVKRLWLWLVQQRHARGPVWSAAQIWDSGWSQADFCQTGQGVRIHVIIYISVALKICSLIFLLWPVVPCRTVFICCEPHDFEASMNLSNSLV